MFPVSWCLLPLVLFWEVTAGVALSESVKESRESPTSCPEELWDLRPSQETQYRINIHHPAVETEPGYLPGLIYQVTIENERGDDSQAKLYILRTMQLDSERKTAGEFLTQGNSTRLCVSGPHPDKMVINETQGGWEALIVDPEQTGVNWIAPNATEISCINFIVYILDISGNWSSAMRRMCKRQVIFRLVTTSSDVLSCGGHGKRYSNNMSYLFLIQSLPGYEIRLQFQHVDLEPYRDKGGKCFDFVGVGTTEWEINNSSRHICGRYTAADVKNLSFVSDGNYMVVKFISDAKIVGTGFLAVSYSNPSSGNNEQEFSKSKGIISSPNFPSEYFPNYDSTYTIKVPTNYRISVTFTDFNLQPKNNGKCLDYVAIETDNNGTMSKEYLCGTNTKVYTSSFNWFRLTFHSDYLVQSSGFRAEYESFRSCENTTYDSFNGTLKSMGYPGPYLNNQYCYITIRLPEEDMKVEIQFDLLQTEATVPTYLSGSRCNLDYLEIYDGNDTNRLCGDWRPELKRLNFRSVAQVMIIKFVSDHAVSGLGFVIRWIAVKGNTSNIPCPCEWSHAFENSCFRIVREIQTWENAKRHCEKLGAQLVIIRSAEVGETVESLITDSNLDGRVFWIGASDRQFESDFHWVDGSRVSYTAWFPGWSGQNYYNRQPNDDGVSDQDCVELRKVFSLLAKGQNVTKKFFWNDRDCETHNMFICEMSKQTGLIPQPVGHFECFYERTVSSVTQSGLVTSPGFPRDYEDNLNCTTIISATPGYVIELSFSYFDLEDSTGCEYDKVMLSSNVMLDNTNAGVAHTYCGNWSMHLKGLKYVTTSNTLRIDFISDHSKSATGFEATYRIVNASSRCPDANWSFYNEACYVIYSDRNLTSYQAESTCLLQGGHLANVTDTSQQQIFKLLRPPDHLSLWIDTLSSILDYHFPSGSRSLADGSSCFTLTFNNNLPSFQQNNCREEKAFVCQALLTGSRPFPTVLVKKSDPSWITSPGYPSKNYPSNAKIKWEISTKEDHIVLFIFEPILLEESEGCLYDAIIVTDECTKVSKRLCGSWSWLSYSITCNISSLEFVTDRDVSLKGFNVSWLAIDRALIKNQTLSLGDNQTQGLITSPNYPISYLNYQDQWTVITTGEEKRILLVLEDLRLNKNELDCSDYLLIHTDRSRHSYAHQLCASSFMGISEREYISTSNYTSILFHTNHFNNAQGFRIMYKLVPRDLYVYTQRRLLTNNASGDIVSVNSPDQVPRNLDYTVSLESPLGTLIQITVIFPNSDEYTWCDDDRMVITDPTKTGTATAKICSNQKSLTILSQMHVIDIRIVTGKKRGVAMESYTIQYQVVKDYDFINKTLFDVNVTVGDCQQQPCLNDGLCVKNSESNSSCECTGHYTGLICRWTYCDRSPCMNGGQCLNVNSGYICKCPSEYGGNKCEYNLIHCGRDSCNSRGKCVFKKNWQLECACEYEYEGTFCEIAREFPITSSSGIQLLDEPFWIGIIVVICFLTLTALIICIKRKCLNYYDFNCCGQNEFEKNDKYGNNENRLYGYGNNGYISDSNPQSPLPSANHSLQSSPKRFRHVPVIQIHSEDNNGYLVYPSSSRFIDNAADVLVPNTADIIDVTSRVSPGRAKASPKLSSINEETFGQGYHNGTDVDSPTEDEHVDSSILEHSSAIGHNQIAQVDLEQEPSNETSTGGCPQGAEYILDSHNNEHVRIKSQDECESPEHSPSFRSQDGKLTGGREEIFMRKRKNSAERREDFVNSVRRARKEHSKESVVSSSPSQSGHSHSACSHCLSVHSGSEHSLTSRRPFRHDSYGERECAYDKGSCDINIRDLERSGEMSRRCFCCSQDVHVMGNPSHKHHRSRRSKRSRNHSNGSRRKDTNSSGDSMHLHQNDSSIYHSLDISSLREYASHGDLWSVSMDITNREDMYLSGMDSYCSTKCDRTKCYQVRVPPDDVENYGGSPKKYDVKRSSHQQLHPTFSGSHSRSHSEQYVAPKNRSHRKRRGHRRKSKMEERDSNHVKAFSVETEKNGHEHHQIRAMRHEHRKIAVSLSDSAAYTVERGHKPLVKTKALQPISSHRNGSDDNYISSPGYLAPYRTRPSVPIKDTCSGSLSLAIHSSSSDDENSNFSRWRSNSLNSAGFIQTDFENCHTNGHFKHCSDGERSCGHQACHSKTQSHINSEDNYDDTCFHQVNAEVHQQKDHHQNGNIDSDYLFKSDLGDPEKHPLQDSAYQSKVQSTDKNNSKPSSDRVSPLHGSTGVHGDCQPATTYKFVPTRMEDKRVLKQLEMVAKRLTGLETERLNQCSDTESELGVPTASAEAKILNEYQPKISVPREHSAEDGKLVIGHKIWPSRVLSMITDEGESECSDNGTRNCTTNASFNQFSAGELQASTPRFLGVKVWTSSGSESKFLEKDSSGPLGDLVIGDEQMNNNDTETSQSIESNLNTEKLFSIISEDETPVSVKVESVPEVRLPINDGTKSRISPELSQVLPEDGHVGCMVESQSDIEWDLDESTVNESNLTSERNSEGPSIVGSVESNWCSEQGLSKELTDGMARTEEGKWEESLEMRERVTGEVTSPSNIGFHFVESCSDV